jgi:hypothetical protein
MESFSVLGTLGVSVLLVFLAFSELRISFEFKKLNIQLKWRQDMPVEHTGKEHLHLPDGLLEHELALCLSWPSNFEKETASSHLKLQATIITVNVK